MLLEFLAVKMATLTGLNNLFPLTYIRAAASMTLKSGGN
jgi:hypothetical protein